MNESMTTAFKRGSKLSYLQRHQWVRLLKADAIWCENAMLEIEPEIFDTKASQPLATSIRLDAIFNSIDKLPELYFITFQWTITPVYLLCYTIYRPRKAERLTGPE